MKHLTLLTFALLFAFTAALGQRIEVTMSPEQKVKKWAEITLLGQYKGTYYGTSQQVGQLNRVKVLTLYSFDSKSLEVKESIPLEIPDLGKFTSLSFIFLKGDVIHIFLTEIKFYSGSYTYYHQSYSLAGSVIDPVKKIGGWDKLPFSNVYQREEAVRPIFALTQDSNKIILYNRIVNKGSDPDKYLVSVFDIKEKVLQPVWSAQFSLPYKDKSVEIQDVVLSGQGKAFLLAKIITPNKDKRELADHFFELIGIGIDKKVVKYPIQLGKLDIRTTYLELDKSGNPVVAGFYAAKKKDAANGLYMLGVDASSGELTTKFAGLVKELYPAYLEGKRVTDYEIRRIIPRIDGGLYIVGEQHAVVITTYYNGKTTSTTVTIFDKTIAVINISAQGDIQWVRRIPKIQYTSGPTFYQSFLLVNNNDNLGFVFNDDPDNLNVLDDNKDTDIDKVKRIDKSMVMLVSVSADGKVTKKALFSNRDSDAILQPPMCHRLSDTRYLLYGQYKKKLNIGLLEFK